MLEDSKTIAANKLVKETVKEDADLKIMERLEMVAMLEEELDNHSGMNGEEDAEECVKTAG